MKNKVLLSSLLLSFFMLSSPTKAEDKEIYDMSLEELLDINVVFAASKKEQKVSKAPANTIIVTREEILQRGYSNLKDVLADLPGMETVDFYFSEVSTLVPVRGVIGNNKIIVLVNGMKVNPPARENMMFRNDQSVRHAKRVEVVYGPGSALYGTDAVSAVINIVTFSPEDYEDKSNSSVMVQGGMNNTLETSLGSGVTFGNNSGFNGFIQTYNSNASDYQSAYPDFFKPYQEVFDNNKKSDTESIYNRFNNGLNAFMNLKVGETTFQYWHRSSKRSSNQGLPSSFPFSEQAIWSDSSNVVRAENNLKLLDNLNATTSLTYNLYEINPETSYVWLLNDSYNYNDDKYGRGRGFEFEERVSWDILNDYKGLNGFSKNLSLTGGVWLADYESVPKATISGGYNRRENLLTQGTDFIYYNSKNDLDSKTNPQSVSPITQLSYQNYSGYLQSDWDILENLNLVLGARLDNDTRFDQIPINPRASLIYSPLNNLTLKFIHGNAFVFPPPYFTHAVFSNPLQINGPNNDIQPERASSNEININYAVGNFSINTGIFYNTQNNLFLLGDSAPDPTIVKNEVWVDGSSESIKLTQNVNNGSSFMYGLDTLIKYNFSKDYKAFASLSFVDGQFNVTGKKTGLQQISNANIRLGSTLRIIDNFYISPRFSWRSNPNLTDEQMGDSKNLFSNLYQLDIHSYYDLNDFRVFVNLNNVTNNKYALFGLYSPVPAESFYLLAGVNYKF